MRQIESKHPPGTVGVIIGSLARYRALFTSLDRLRVPKGTTLIYAESADIARNCNSLVDSMTGEWLWIMGDDHRFGPDILMKLLDREVDIIVPLVSMRNPPFDPVIYKTLTMDGTISQLYSWDQLPNSGLIQVEAAGTAGMLVKRHVFAVTTKPWFGFQEHASEDIVFCWKARAASFKIHADLDQSMTHITPCELEPKKDKSGKWKVVVTVCGQIVNQPKEASDFATP